MANPFPEITPIICPSCNLPMLEKVPLKEKAKFKCPNCKRNLQIYFKNKSLALFNYDEEKRPKENIAFVIQHLTPKTWAKIIPNKWFLKIITLLGLAFLFIKYYKN